MLIAAITSCTNTSNPSVMLAAGLLAKKAVERGLQVNPLVKASLAPGSRVVTDYLEQTGLQKYLDQLGFNLVGYGCTTCIGNSGPLPAAVDEAIGKYDLIAASVLSGNRNFEARVHQSIKANFLMSPPLVVAFALAGRVDIDLSREPIGKGKDGEDVYLKDIWPTLQEVRDRMQAALSRKCSASSTVTSRGRTRSGTRSKTGAGNVYPMGRQQHLYPGASLLRGFRTAASAKSCRDQRRSRTGDLWRQRDDRPHLAGRQHQKEFAGGADTWLSVALRSRISTATARAAGNDRVMTRGTFANVRIKNLMVPGTEGGVTRCFASKACECAPGEQVSIYEAAMAYQKEGTPLVVIAGQEYGTGSSRDWAAKGTALLGVKAVVAQSFERIHRSNLVGMGVLPLQFKEGASAQTLKLDGTETFDVLGLGQGLKPQQDLTLRIRAQRAGGDGAGDLPD